MIKLGFLLAFLTVATQSNGQCDCEKITRDQGEQVVMCNPLPVSYDKSTQIALSAASNGSENYLALTVRFRDIAQNLSSSGQLSIRLADNTLVSASLVSQQLSYIGNSQVVQGMFTLSSSQKTKLANSPIKTVSFKLTDEMLRTYQGIQNKNVLTRQLTCL